MIGLDTVVPDRLIKGNGTGGRRDVSIFMKGNIKFLQGDMQAIGNGLAGFILSIARQALVFLPVVIVFQRLFGLEGIFLSFPAADLIASLALAGA